MKTLNIPNMTRRTLISKTAASVVATSFSVWGVPAHACFLGLCDGVPAATEVTQWANNLLLTSQLAQQVAMVRTQIDQYTTMLTNLQALANMPMNLVDSATSPVRVALGSIQKLRKSVTDLGLAATGVGTVWQRSLKDITALKLTPEVYFDQQRQLADKRGGIYKLQWDKDLASMKELEDNITNVRSLANSIPGIKGNIQGLQLLNTQMNQMLQANTEMQAIMTRKSANELQDRMDKEQANVLAAEYNKKNAEVMKARVIRDADMKATFKAPWEE